MSSNSNPDICFSYQNGADILPTLHNNPQLKLVATFHTHPHEPGYAPPKNCHIKDADDPTAVFGDGASTADYAAVNSLGWNVPMYILDFDHVHRIRPHQHFGGSIHTEARSKNCN
jgi:hypothetical protein